MYQLGNLSFGGKIASETLFSLVIELPCGIFIPLNKEKPNEQETNQSAQTKQEVKPANQKASI